MLINQLLNWINSICTFVFSHEHEFVILYVASEQRPNKLENMSAQCMWNYNSIYYHRLKAFTFPARQKHFPSFFFCFAFSFSNLNWFKLTHQWITTDSTQLSIVRVLPTHGVDECRGVKIEDWNLLLIITFKDTFRKWASNQQRNCNYFLMPTPRVLAFKTVESLLMVVSFIYFLMRFRKNNKKKN